MPLSLSTSVLFFLIPFGFFDERREWKYVRQGLHWHICDWGWMGEWRGGGRGESWGGFLPTVGNETPLPSHSTLPHSTLPHANLVHLARRGEGRLVGPVWLCVSFRVRRRGSDRGSGIVLALVSHVWGGCRGRGC